jgi:hypothetical protein
LKGLLERCLFQGSDAFTVANYIDKFSAAEVEPLPPTPVPGVPVEPIP